mmetsp:Transcript_26145/g.65884  ORF Transcript_26145/g.65884 Transcript_26145/m.65884 type:complete len:227 (-) Transcript_26145:162-842(-)|eukprot:g798.t1
MLIVSALAPTDWEKLTSLPTADLCDEYGDKILYFPAFPFRSFGKRRRFCGFAQTVDCRHGDNSHLLDNTYVKSLANEKQTRDAVLFVHGGGLLAPNAVVGDQIAEKARANGFTGFVVFGNVRDCAEIDQKMDLGVKALSTHPRKTMKANKGVRGKEIKFELVTTSSASAARSGAESGVTVRPGDFVVADEDGIVMVPKEDGRARGRNSHGAAGGAGEESEQKRAKL